MAKRFESEQKRFYFCNYLGVMVSVTAKLVLHFLNSKKWRTSHMAKPGKLPDFRKMYPEASEEVIAFLKESERKMQYQEYDRKAEQVVINQEQGTVTFIPSMEDSYERISGQSGAFQADQPDIETVVLNKIIQSQLYQALQSLSEQERYLILQIFFFDRTERDLAAELNLSQQAGNKRKHCILGQLKKYFEEF